MPLLLGELRPHGLDLILLFLLVLIPLHTAGHAIAGSIVDGVVEAVDIAFQGGDGVLLRLNAGSPLFGGGLVPTCLRRRSDRACCFGARDGGHGRRDVVVQFFVGNNSLGRLWRRSVFRDSVFALNVFALGIFAGRVLSGRAIGRCILGGRAGGLRILRLGVLLLPLRTGLASDVPERG